MTMKERIMEAATHFIARDGFEGLKIEDLAKYIGISKKTIYNHFPGKYALVDSALKRDVERICGTLDKIAFDKSTELIKRLANIMEYGFQSISEWGKLMLNEMSLLPKALGEQHALVLRNKIIEIVNVLMEEGIEKGIVRTDLKKEFIPYFYLTIVEGSLSMYNISDLEMSRETLFSQSISLTCLGILSREGKEEFEAYATRIPGMRKEQLQEQ